MKKELCLMSALLVLCSSYNCVNAEEKTVPPAPPASKPQPFINVPAKPAAGDVAKDANADPLEFVPDLVAKIEDEKITKAEIMAEFKPVISMMKENGQLGTIPPESSQG